MGDEQLLLIIYSDLKITKVKKTNMICSKLPKHSVEQNLLTAHHHMRHKLIHIITM